MAMTTDGRTALHKIIDRLPSGHSVTWRSNGVRVTCPCPDHGNGDGDQHPSLDLDLRNGRILVKCRVGCSQDAVMTAFASLGLTAGDLRVEPSGSNSPRAREINAVYPYHDE